VDRYTDFTVLTPVIINEFVDKIIVHERDRKSSIQTTQKIEIYFNFIGEYKPSTMREPELTEEEKEKLARKEAIKDKRHAQYMARRADGRDAAYNKQTAARRAQQREDRRKTRRWEDIQAGIYHEMGTREITVKNGTDDSKTILVSAEIPRQ
jgi:hypothetical protein